MGTSPNRSFAAVAVLVVTAAGCTAQPTADDRAAAGTSAGSSTTPPPPATTTTTSRKPVRLPPVTPPGTVLAAGRPAVIPAIGSVAPNSLVEVTATLDSRPITDADIQRLPLNEENKAQLRGKSFIFIRTTYVNLAGANLRDMSTVSLFPGTRSGGWPGALLMLGNQGVIEGCESGHPDETFNEVGAKLTNCEPHFGVADDPVVSLVHDDPPYSKEKPLTWRLG